VESVDLRCEIGWMEERVRKREEGRVFRGTRVMRRRRASTCSAGGDDGGIARAWGSRHGGASMMRW
jgi:hypothetical protein